MKGNERPEFFARIDKACNAAAASCLLLVKTVTVERVNASGAGFPDVFPVRRGRPTPEHLGEPARWLTETRLDELTPQRRRLFGQVSRRQLRRSQQIRHSDI